MKKFMRNCSIVALVMVTFGIVLVAVPAIVKGPAIHSSVNQYLNENLDTWTEQLETNLALDLEKCIDFENYAKNDLVIGEVTQSFESTDIKNLIIELGTGELECLPSEDEKFHVQMEGAGGSQSSILDNTLVINAPAVGEITLYVPRDFTFENAEITLGAGEISGDCSWIADNLNIVLAAGEVELELPGKEADYNYSVEVTAGEVVVGGTSFGGFVGKKEINNNATRNISINCAMGNVELEFQE